MTTANEMNSHEVKYDRLLQDLAKKEVNIDSYTSHADDYEEYMMGLHYKVPKKCATVTMKHIKGESSGMEALDICVGTGLASLELVDAGFNGKIDGVDGNEEMMERAKEKGIFRNLLKQIVTPDTQLPFQDGTYDIVVCTGGFSAGHIDPGCIPDFFRVLKSGGIFSFNTIKVNQKAGESGNDSLNKADPVLNQLINKGVCEKVEEIVMGGFEFSKNYKHGSNNVTKIHWYRKL